MDVFRPNGPEPEGAAFSPDPRLQPTPDFGTLGPGSDLPIDSRSATASNRPAASTLRMLHFAAAMAGIGLAVAVSSAGGVGSIWKRLSAPPAPRVSLSSSVISDRDLDHQKPQRQAEILLERAVTRTDGATNQIEARVDSWRGKLKWDAHLGELTTVALNSSDSNVRDSAVEVQLAAYGLSKNESTVERLLQQANSADHAKKIWAFWSLGLLANRGIQTDRVVGVLTANLMAVPRESGGSANDEDSRRWAVEGLALIGTTQTIAPLLDALHNDSSALVRERAACSLAESGMFTHQQRLLAVPQLIRYSDDPTLDTQTRGWVFQALGDITKQRLPNDSAAWRNWYQNSAGGVE
jgi:hypothetical protein